jgi:hypothetical protein
MQGTNNNRCPNCGAPLRTGLTAAECDYCGNQAKQTPVQQAANADFNQTQAKHHPAPAIHTNAIKYLVVWLLSLVGIAMVGKEHKIPFTILGVICIGSIYLLMGSMLIYAFKKVRYWLANRN